MILAAAQIKVEIGDLKGNLNHHLRMMNLAVENNVDMLVFPEMSLTGYCREEAFDLAFSKNDIRLAPLQEFSSKNNIIIIVGAPIKIEKNLYIGSFIIQPNTEIDIYIKQFLHEGEEIFFKNSFDYNPILKVHNEHIAFAICADIDIEQHAVNASKNNCSIYLPSIFFSDESIAQGHEILANYAKKYNFNILMSNYSGKHWNTVAGGKSAFWNSKGEKINELNTSKEGLLITTKEINDHWSIKRIQL